MMLIRLAVMLLVASALAAAELPAPTVKIGAAIFTDFTYTQSPETIDANGNRVNASSFNVTRAYINVIGTAGPRFTFRVTPDIMRESGSGSSIAGSQTFRLKFAYAQVNLDEWATPGSWVRGGMVPTPYFEFMEGIYRYRFQGSTFADREGYLFTSDTGLAARYAFAGDRADIAAGIFNGEGFARSEANDQKALQVRATWRPVKPLALTAFVDSDHYVADDDRNRLIGAVTYEHARGTAGLEYLKADDHDISGSGFSAWLTPRLGHNLEVLLRHDRLEPDDRTDARKRRTIAGIAYWIPMPKGVSAAIMLDRDGTSYRGYASNPPDETRYGIHAMVSF